MTGSLSEVEFYMQCQRSRPPRGQGRDRGERIQRRAREARRTKASAVLAASALNLLCDLRPLCAGRIHRRSKTLDRPRFTVVICNISVLTCLFHLLYSPAFTLFLREVLGPRPPWRGGVMKRVLSGLSSAVLIVLLTVTTVWAQGGATAQISGLVRDQSAGVLPWRRRHHHTNRHRLQA